MSSLIVGSPTHNPASPNSESNTNNHSQDSSPAKSNGENNGPIPNDELQIIPNPSPNLPTSANAQDGASTRAQPRKRGRPSSGGHADSQSAQKKQREKAPAPPQRKKRLAPLQKVFS